MANLDRMKQDVGEYIDLFPQEIMKQMLWGSPSLRHFLTIARDAQAGTTIMVPNIDMGEVWQSFQPEFNEKGDINIGAETTVQRRHKVNVGLDPDVLNGEWSGQKTLNGMNLIDEGKQREDMALPQFAMQKIAERVSHDREMKVIVKGKYVGPTSGQESPAEEACDGLLKLMDDATNTAITYGERAKLGAAKLEPFAMGAIPTGAKMAYEYFKDFKARIPEIYREQPLKVFASRNYCDRYAEDKQEMSSFRGQFADGMQIDNTNMSLHALPGLAGFDTIFAVAPRNLLRFIHKNDGISSNLKVNAAEMYKLKIGGDFHECYGVANWDFFFSNDQIPVL